MGKRHIYSFGLRWNKLQKSTKNKQLIIYNHNYSITMFLICSWSSILIINDMYNLLTCSSLVHYLSNTAKGEEGTAAGNPAFKEREKENNRIC